MTPSDAAMHCPYVGLQPFATDHAAFFFGRERDQRLIIANLLASPLTILYGSSGVGKSSVINAGVLPHLRRDRPGTPVIVYRDWSRANFRLDLVRECINAVWEKEPAQPKPSDELPFDDVLRACAEAARETVLILFDQFEEYFLYHPKSSASDSFEADFARAVNRDDVDVGFLIALREDGLAKLDRFQERIPNLLSNRLRLKHLDEAGARMAIRGPLDVWNRRPSAETPPWSIEDELVDLLIDQIRVGQVSVARQTGSGLQQKEGALIEAPFLQLVMVRLWDAEGAKGSRLLRAQTLTDLGGAAAIVGRHLDEVMERLDATGQAVSASIFDRLVTPTGSKIACSREALAGWAGASLAAHVGEVLNTLCVERILRATQSAESPEKSNYEVFHDVLAPAILDWRARYIAAREQEEAVRLEREEAQQRAEREQEELKRRAQRRLVLVFGVMFLIAAAGWCYSFIEGTRAAANGKAAEGILAASRDEPLQALDLALEAVDETPFYGFPPTQAAEDALRQSLRILPNREQIVDVPDWVWDVAFSPDGRRVATCGRDNAVTLWELEGGALKPLPVSLPHPKDVREVAFLPSDDPSVGDRLLTVSGDSVRLFDLSEPAAEPRIFSHGSDIYHAFAVSGDGKRVATAGWAGDGQPSSIKVWDLETADPNPIAEIDLQGGRVMDLAFSPDGCCLATAMVSTGGVDRSYTEVWGIDSRQKILAVPNTVDSDVIAFSGDGDALIIGGRDNRARIFRPSEGRLTGVLAERARDEMRPEQVAVVGTASLSLAEPSAIPWETMVLAGHTDRIRDLAHSRDGNRIATAGADGTVRIWDAASGQTLFTLRGHRHFVEAVAFSPDGRYLVTGSRDKTIRLWDVSRHAGSVNGIAFSPGGDAVATAGADGTAKIWDVTGDTPRLRRTLRGHQREIYRLAFDPSGKWLATAGFDNTARLWEVAGDHPPTVLTAHQDQLRDVEFDPGSRYLATAGADGFVHLYDLHSPATAPAVSVEHHSGKPIVQALAVALGPRLWASSGLNTVIRFWSYAGENRGSLQRKGFASFRDLAFHPDGREIAALGINQVIVWPEEQFGVADAAPRLVLDLSDARVCSSIAYSHDGTRLAVACKDSSVYIFDMRNGKRVQTITAHDAGVNQAVFSPDGKRLATASADGTFLIAPLDFSQLHPLARRLRDKTAATARGSNPD